jgi:hypothetical protein
MFLSEPISRKTQSQNTRHLYNPYHAIGRPVDPVSLRNRVLRHGNQLYDAGGNRFYTAIRADVAIPFTRRSSTATV